MAALRRAAAMTRTRKRAAPAPAPAPASGFGALSASDAHTVLSLLLPKLPVFERASAGAVNRAWRDAASAPDVWARVDLDGCAASIDVRALVAICARAGAALVELRVTLDCPLLSSDVMLYALVAGGCVSLRTLTLPLPSIEAHRIGSSAMQLSLLGVAAARALRRASPALENLTATLLCLKDDDIAAGQLLPGASLALVVPPFLVFGDDGTRCSADLRHPSVATVHLGLQYLDEGLTEEQAVAMVELAKPRDEQRDSAESAEPKQAPLFCAELVGAAVGDATAAAVAVALRAPRCALRGVNLCGDALTDSGGSAIANALADNASLRALHLRSFDDEVPVLGDMTASALAAALRVNSNLNLLDLAGEFSDAACADLFSGLAGHTGLRTLELRSLGSEAMGGSAGSAFGAALSSPSCRLEKAWLHFGGGFEPAASAALGAGLAGNKSLRKLKIYASVGATPSLRLLALAQALHSALLVNTTLQSLDVMDLDGRAMVALAPALAVHPSLTDVNFSFSCFGDAGTIALARALAAPTCACVCLDVRWCDIGKRGGEALADALRHNTRLEMLDTNNNEHFPIDTLGRALRANAASRLNTLVVDHTRPLGVVVKALIDHRSLTSLTLHDFSFSSEGDAAGLATMLSQPRCALRKLHLQMVRGEVQLWNVLRRRDVVTLASGLSRNTSLTWLNIEEANFEVADTTTLGRALRGHPRLSVLQFHDTRWSHGAASALVRALCEADGDDDEGSFDALALLYLEFTDSDGDPLSVEEEEECTTLMESRQPYALTLLERVNI